uniref:Epidermal patterning factor-like protein n=1 Tax=Davidia involucrata TaxID=16924 RepID=A0A5B7AU64_DAVIN
MEYWRTIKLRFLNKTPLFYFISIFFFFSTCALLGTINSKTPCLDIRPPLTGKADFYFHENGDGLIASEGNGGVSLSLATTRRFLSGPGSSPPRCTSKCGRCTPCKPVHVPVPPGTPVTAEYYPEAWRCKCGNKLYMP